MKVCLSFLEFFNGKAYFPEFEWSDNETLELYTDSVGSDSVATELGRLRHFKGYYFP